LNDSALRSRCLYGLQKVSARCGLLPRGYWISYSRLADPNSASYSTGGMSDTRRGAMDGEWATIRRINPDCIKNFPAFKRVRLSPAPNQFLSIRLLFWLLQRLCTSVIIWKRLQHPNLVSFLGFVAGVPPFSLVYDWVSNGSLSDYVREYPSVDKLGLVSSYSWHSRPRIE